MLFRPERMQAPSEPFGALWHPILRLPDGGRAAGWVGSEDSVKWVADDLNDLLARGWLRAGPSAGPSGVGSVFLLLAGEIPLWGTWASGEAPDLGSVPVPSPPASWEPLAVEAPPGAGCRLALAGEAFALSHVEATARRLEEARGRLRVGVTCVPASGHRTWYAVRAAGLPEGWVPRFVYGGTSLPEAVDRAERLRRRLAAEPPKVLPRHDRDLGV